MSIIRAELWCLSVREWAVAFSLLERGSDAARGTARQAPSPPSQGARTVRRVTC